MRELKQQLACKGAEVDVIHRGNIQAPNLDEGNLFLFLDDAHANTHSIGSPGRTALTVATDRGAPLRP